MVSWGIAAGKIEGDDACIWHGAWHTSHARYLWLRKWNLLLNAFQSSTPCDSMWFSYAVLRFHSRISTAEVYVSSQLRTRRQFGKSQSIKPTLLPPTSRCWGRGALIYDKYIISVYSACLNTRYRRTKFHQLQCQIFIVKYRSTENQHNRACLCLTSTGA